MSLKHQLRLGLFAQGRVRCFLGDLAVHGRLKLLPAGSLCHLFVPLMNQPVADDVQPEQEQRKQQRRPHIEQDQQTGYSEHEEQPKRRSEEHLSKPVAAAVKDRTEGPSWQHARGQNDQRSAEHEASTCRSCLHGSPKPQVEPSKP